MTIHSQMTSYLNVISTAFLNIQAGPPRLTIHSSRTNTSFRLCVSRVRSNMKLDKMSIKDLPAWTCTQGGDRSPPTTGPLEPCNANIFGAEVSSSLEKMTKPPNRDLRSSDRKMSCVGDEESSITLGERLLLWTKVATRSYVCVSKAIPSCQCSSNHLLVFFFFFF